jgi:Ca2+-binding RTX toxin-like protein
LPLRLRPCHPPVLSSTVGAGPWGPSPALATCGGDPFSQTFATIVGSSASERLVGTTGNDVIAALGGHDTIIGNGGNDIICGGSGDDRIFAGTEQWYAGFATQPGAGSTIYGQSGSDIIYGSAFDDMLFGGAGIDSLYGLGGADELFGGTEVDILAGGTGPDRVRGEGGNDWHYGDGSFGGFFPLFSCSYSLCGDDGSPDTLIDDVDDNIVISYNNGDNVDILWVTTTSCNTSSAYGTLESADPFDQVYCAWP